MKNMNFGFQNELEANTQEELATKAARMDAYIGIICLIVLAVYAVAAHLDGVPK